jgi:hypothetical protein
MASARNLILENLSFGPVATRKRIRLFFVRRDQAGLSFVRVDHRLDGPNREEDVAWLARRRPQQRYHLLHRNPHGSIRLRSRKSLLHLPLRKQRIEMAPRAGALTFGDAAWRDAGG